MNTEDKVEALCCAVEAVASGRGDQARAIIAEIRTTKSGTFERVADSIRDAAERLGIISLGRYYWDTVKAIADRTVNAEAALNALRGQIALSELHNTAMQSLIDDLAEYTLCQGPCDKTVDTNGDSYCVPGGFVCPVCRAKMLSPKWIETDTARHDKDTPDA